MVETLSSLTKGRQTTATTRKMPMTRNERASAFCMAMRLGTSSPSTREKYEVISVMSTMLTPDTIDT